MFRNDEEEASAAVNGLLESPVSESFAVAATLGDAVDANFGFRRPALHRQLD